MLDRVVVINDDTEERGGAAAVALASVRLLRQRGVPVTVLSSDGGSTALVQLGADAVALGGQHIMSGNRAAAALRGLYDAGTGAAVADWIAVHDTPGTVYHLHNWHKVLSPSVFRALKPIASRLLISAHDYFLVCPNGGYFRYPQQSACQLAPGSIRCLAANCDRRHYGHKLWRVARHAVRRFLFDLTDTLADILVVHEGMVPHLMRGGVPRRRLRVLRNPVVPWRPSRVPAEDNRAVFYVGRVEADKGVDLLARAARRAGVRLRIIGAGSLEAAVRHENPTAELLGWQSREQLAQLVSDARIVVIPTRCRETFGLAGIEALLSGIPAIVSQFSLISDEIVRHGFGLSCDPYDEAALTDAITALDRDDGRVREISCRAFSGARMLAPTPEQWCDDLLRIYESKLAAARLPAEAVGDPEPGSGGDADSEDGSRYAARMDAAIGMTDALH
jgi:glycosyltransferase involved in cell wall biosynthesis